MQFVQILCQRSYTARAGPSYFAALGKINATVVFLTFTYATAPTKIRNHWLLSVRELLMLSYVHRPGKPWYWQNCVCIGWQCKSCLRASYIRAEAYLTYLWKTSHLPLLMQLSQEKSAFVWPCSAVACWRHLCLKWHRKLLCVALKPLALWKGKWKEQRQGAECSIKWGGDKMFLWKKYVVSPTRAIGREATMKWRALEPCLPYRTVGPGKS